MLSLVMLNHFFFAHAPSFHLLLHPCSSLLLLLLVFSILFCSFDAFLPSRNIPPNRVAVAEDPSPLLILALLCLFRASSFSTPLTHVLYSVLLYSILPCSQWPSCPIGILSLFHIVFFTNSSVFFHKLITLHLINMSKPTTNSEFFLWNALPLCEAIHRLVTGNRLARSLSSPRRID